MGTTMDAYLMFVGKARLLWASSRNHETILAQILDDPSFDECVGDDAYPKRLTADQKTAFAKKILADALDRESKRLG